MFTLICYYGNNDNESHWCVCVCYFLAGAVSVLSNKCRDYWIQSVLYLYAHPSNSEIQQWLHIGKDSFLRVSWAIHPVCVWFYILAPCYKLNFSLVKEEVLLTLLEPQ